MVNVKITPHRIFLFENFPPNNDIHIRFVAILKAEYYSNILVRIFPNIGLQKSLEILELKVVFFSFLTWRYILTTWSITIIISCLSANRSNTGHLHKTQLFMLFQKIFHFSITNYSKIFKYSNILNYLNIIRIYFTARIIFAIWFGQFGWGE